MPTHPSRAPATGYTVDPDGYVVATPEPASIGLLMGASLLISRRRKAGRGSLPEGKAAGI